LCLRVFYFNLVTDYIFEHVSDGGIE
jgi:hypothetical protein